MVQAVRKIARKVRKGKFVPSEINETTISQHLYPEKDAPVSDVDLIIRTGGDERMSNFLPWQASGNECATYFCAPYWPDFRRVDFLRSVRLYQQHAAEKEKSFSERAYHLLKETGNKEISPKHTAVSVLHE
jgi:tritrans,polycis-undecaprenyl-diphosphate synthase [geranylgeranyl-diphosphate specific]